MPPPLKSQVDHAKLKVHTKVHLEDAKVKGEPWQIVIAPYVMNKGVPEQLDGFGIEVRFTKIDDAIEFLRDLHAFVPAWWAEHVVTGEKK